MDELPYLLQAATEFEQYQTFLRSVTSVAPDKAYDTARAIIMKYSLLVDPPDQPGHPPPLAHHDLRQALHLIDITLDAVPKRQPARFVAAMAVVSKGSHHGCLQA